MIRNDEARMTKPESGLSRDDGAAPVLKPDARKLWLEATRLRLTFSKSSPAAKWIDRARIHNVGAIVWASSFVIRHSDFVI